LTLDISASSAFFASKRVHTYVALSFAGDVCSLSRKDILAQLSASEWISEFAAADYRLAVWLKSKE
jgi:hypothetical protein